MANKLLLLKDVDGLGRKGDLVTARPGYIRNFLLPQGAAIVADANTLRMQARLQEERNKQAAVDKKESEDLSGKIQLLTLTKIVKIDQEGHMYGSVSAVDIIHLLQEEGFTIEKRAVQLQHPIKATGDYDVKLKLKEGVATSFKLQVLPEEPAVQPLAKKQ